MVNLAVVEPGYYFAQGTYGFSETGLRLPLQSQFRVEAFPNSLVIEGQARHSSGTKIGFRCEFGRDSTSQSQAEATLVVGELINVSGRVSLLGPTIELLAYDLPSNTVVSARVVPLERPRVYEFSGFVSLNGLQWFPFHFRAVPTEEEAALSNVVGIHTKKAG